MSTTCHIKRVSCRRDATRFSISDGLLLTPSRNHHSPGPIFEHQKPAEGCSMALSEEQAKSYMVKLLTAMTRAGGSDLFVSKDFPPSMKTQGKMQPLATQKLTGEITPALPHAIISQLHLAES